MSTATMQLAEPSGLLSIGMFVVPVALLVLLLGGFWLGTRIRLRQSRPRPEEQPHLPPGGAVHETRESREPREVPRVPKGGRPLLPHEMGGFGNSSTQSGHEQSRPRWSPGNSGAWGGGGPGR
ncbi:MULTISPECIES: DUF6479 family protein [Streptomyces]|nr:DUF6479 family protein [Streptomyces glaucescens]